MGNGNTVCRHNILFVVFAIVLTETIQNGVSFDQAAKIGQELNKLCNAKRKNDIGSKFCQFWNMFAKKRNMFENTTAKCIYGVANQMQVCVYT